MQPAPGASVEQSPAPPATSPALLGDAFVALYEREFDYVARTLRRLGVHEADLDDQCQEVFLRVHGRMSDFDPGQGARAWLLSFAARVAANYRRLARHKIEVLDESPIHQRPSPGDTPERASMRGDARQLVLAALEALDFDRRVALVAHDIDELPASEIAAALQIPLNTVYSRIRLGRIDFKKAVSRLQSNEGCFDRGPKTGHGHG